MSMLRLTRAIGKRVDIEPTQRPMSNPNRIQVVVLAITKDREGRPEVELGFVAPKEVKIRRHEISRKPAHLSGWPRRR